ncbi:MAG TPA: FAD-dependent oxidoreductase [Bryobacteraceae bacterium]|jgi:phytoene dehydrogenase-like protein|nr:FAD-dependent oxidoreductase [Bryobacteraceae bacterium]
MQPEPFIVIGGGLAGLTAATALVRHGRSVILHEQSSHLGGRAVTQRQRGFALNLGPHAVYRAGALLRTFSEWNIPVPGKPVRLSGNCWLLDGGKQYRFPAGSAGLFASDAFTVSEKLSIAKLLTILPSPRAPMTFDEWLSEHVRAGRPRQFFTALARLSTYVRNPGELDATAALNQLRLAISGGVVYVDGGWQTLIDGLEEKAISLGVRISTRSVARRVEPHAVHLASGERISCAGVILATPPDDVEQLTGTHFPSLSPARIACLDIALRKLPAKCAQFALGLEEPVYFSRQSTYARIAPEGGAVIHLGRYLAPGEEASRESLESLASSLMPGWEPHAETVRYLPNMLVTAAIPTPAGRPAADSIPGITLAGDWIGSDAMLADASVSSGLHAAELVQRRTAAAA